MIIRSQADLKAALLPKIQRAIEKTQMQIYDIIDKVLMEYYNSYSPEQYHRTYQLLRSLVYSKVEETANGYKAEVYFDIGSLKYKPSWSGEQTMENAGVKGIRGYRGKGQNIPIPSPKIWIEPITQIEPQAIEMLVNNLKSIGVPIK